VHLSSRLPFPLKLSKRTDDGALIVGFKCPETQYEVLRRFFVALSGTRQTLVFSARRKERRMSERASAIDATLIKSGQISYAIFLAVQGILEIFYGNFRSVLLPMWPTQIPGVVLCARIVGAALIAAGMALVIGMRGREIALTFGGVYLVSALLCQLPYALFVDPKTINLFSWGRPFNALVMAGCSFVVAASFPENRRNASSEPSLLGVLEKIMPAGRTFFCITIIRFGIGHYLHTTQDAALIPDWIPWHRFWTYFTGAALIGSGIAIISKLELRITAVLLGGMIFLWVVMLHIPRAFADPHSGQGNEIESAARALAESGTAFLIACTVSIADSSLRIAPSSNQR
jgi:uncharacterized membrane protein YphA (DoxX/SURF4 family)